MSQLRDMPVSRKLTLAFGLVCALCVASGIYTFLAFQGITVGSSDLARKSIPSLLVLDNMRGDIHQIRRHDLTLLLCRKPDCVGKHTTQRLTAYDDFARLSDAYQPDAENSREAGLFQQIHTYFAAYKLNSDHGVSKLLSGNAGEAANILDSEESNADYEGLIKTISTDLELNANLI